MNLRLFLKATEKFVTDNSPTLLTAIGVVGTIGTAYLTGRATLRCHHVLVVDMPLQEKVKYVWKEYIPPIASGTLTIASIVCANRIGVRRATALAAAYTVSEKAYEEYRHKVRERIGETKEVEIRDSIQEDRVRNTPGSSEVVLGDGNVLCYDSITGRYFQSTVESLRKAANDINFQINHEMYASLYEFQAKIGLAPTEYSSEVGWNTDHQLELNFTTVLSEDGRPCLCVNYNVMPIRDYFRLG